MSWAIGRSRRRSSTSRWPSSGSRERSARSRTCASIGGTALSLGWVEDGHLVCAYHGWMYDPDGVCTRIPASHRTNIPSKARIVGYRAAEHAGLIWVCLEDGEPAMPLPAFPEWSDDAYRKIKIPQYDWHCSAARRVENFVDFSHFAWVHEGILGDRSKPEIPDHDVVRDATTLSFELGIEEPANPVKGDAGDAGRIERTPSRYTISMPFSVHLDQPLEGDTHFVLFVASCPLSAKETRNFTWNARNDELDPDADQGFIDFQQVILEQDRVVVESQPTGGAADRPVRGAPHQGHRPRLDRLPSLARRDRNP